MNLLEKMVDEDLKEKKQQMRKKREKKRKGQTIIDEIAVLKRMFDT